MGVFWQIAWKEAREAFRDLRFWISLVLLGIALPAAYGSYAAAVRRDLQDWLLLVLLLPATYSVQTAVISFVSEKEAKTIEPLLAIPASDGEIFGGKVVASAIPPLAIAVVAVISFMVAASVGFARMGYQLEWDVASVAASFFIAFMALWTMVGFGVLISARTSSVRSAQQMTAVITLPVIFLVVGQGEGLIHFVRLSPLVVVGIFIALNILIFRWGLRMMRREGILKQMG